MEGGFDLNIPFDLNEYDGDDAILLEGVGESPDPDSVPNTDAATGAAATGAAGATGAEGSTSAAADPVVGDAAGHGAAEGGVEFVGAIGGDGFLLDAPEPHVGMLFDSLIDARNAYNAYAYKIGFSMKANTSRRLAYTKELEKQQFVCNRFKKPAREEVDVEKMINQSYVDDSDRSSDGGESDHSKSCSKKPGSSISSCREKKKRNREVLTQIQCKARMVVKHVGAKWKVTYFIGEHNHPLIEKPSMKRYLRSHQGIPPLEKKLLETLHSCNIPSGRLMQIMSHFYGEEGFVPYGTKHISNMCAGLRSKTQENDMHETLNYFSKIHEDEDPGLFVRVKMDKEERTQNLFWVDGAARKAYAAAYSDCISFDTTFMTNCYNMPFAPFIGINRHGKSFMLGCGFLRDEKETAFDWLFQVFLEAMGGKQPGCIITDQDVAMKNSIANIFPNAIHRNCRWHIMKNA